MLTEKLATNEAGLLIGKKEIGIVGVEYMIAVLGLEPGEDLNHLHLLPRCQRLVRFEHYSPPL
jgi:hypothetical protein